MFTSLSRFYPKPLRNRYKSLTKYCDIEIEPDNILGMGIFFGAILSLLLSAVGKTIFSLSDRVFIIGFVAVFLLTQVIVYTWLALRAEAKGKFVEDILPDALLIMSMNIKSGMTTDRALIISARPEFGPLERELSRAGKQILAGKDIKQALIGMTARVKSPMFDRTIRLIIEGIESGGELSSLLQQTAEDIQNTKIVNNEVRSNLLMYAIFIFFAAGFGAPLLFGISSHLVGSVGTQISGFQSAGLVDQPAGGTFKVSKDFLTMFAVISLSITSIFGGLIVGIVKNGSEKAGVKLIPLLLVMAFGVFFAIRMLVAAAFPSF